MSNKRGLVFPVGKTYVDGVPHLALHVQVYAARKCLNLTTFCHNDLGTSDEQGTCVIRRRFRGIWEGLLRWFDVFRGREVDTDEKVLSWVRNP